MSEQVIPLQAVPNQTFTVELAGQQCEFEFITRGLYMYMNLAVNGEKIINGQICLNNVSLISYKTSKFKGDLHFEDWNGDLDPLYYGLTDRWFLIYVE